MITEIIVNLIICAGIVRDIVPAFYYKPLQDIYLCTDKDQEPGYLQHEIGHFIRYERIPDKGRKYWDKLSLSCDNNECFVNDYAKISPQEDWAETYRYVKEGGQKKELGGFFGLLDKDFKIFNLKIKIIEYIVNRYTDFTLRYNK